MDGQGYNGHMMVDRMAMAMMTAGFAVGWFIAVVLTIV